MFGKHYFCVKIFINSASWSCKNQCVQNFKTYVFQPLGCEYIFVSVSHHCVFQCSLVEHVHQNAKNTMPRELSPSMVLSMCGTKGTSQRTLSGSSRRSLFEPICRAQELMYSVERPFMSPQTQAKHQQEIMASIPTSRVLSKRDCNPPTHHKLI